MTNNLGLNLKRIRGLRDLTQWALSLKANVTPQTVTNIETGKNKKPRPGTIKALARALQVDESELIGGPG